jgi:hypothetical protein
MLEVNILLAINQPSTKLNQWQARRDSNPQHPDLESGALPLELLAYLHFTLSLYAKYEFGKTGSIF